MEAPRLTFAAVLMAVGMMAEEHEQTDAYQHGSQQPFAPFAHGVLQMQQADATAEQGYQYGAQQRISHRAAKGEEEALPECPSARGDVAADIAYRRHVRAERTGRNARQEAQQEGCQQGSLRTVEYVLEDFCHDSSFVLCRSRCSVSSGSGRFYVTIGSGEGLIAKSSCPL